MALWLSKTSTESAPQSIGYVDKHLSRREPPYRRGILFANVDVLELHLFINMEKARHPQSVQQNHTQAVGGYQTLTETIPKDKRLMSVN